MPAADERHRKWRHGVAGQQRLDVVHGMLLKLLGKLAERTLEKQRRSSTIR
jgi:hypothetical protein